MIKYIKLTSFVLLFLSGFLEAYSNQKDYSENPLYGPLQWRYVQGIGYRKFTKYGALRKDYSDIRDTFYYRYRYNPGGGSYRF